MSFEDLARLLVEFNRYTSLPALLYFLFFSREWKKPAGIVFYIALFSFLSDFFSFIYAKYVFPNTYGIINTWHFVNLWAVGIYFLGFLPKKRTLILVFLSSLSVCFFVTHVFFYDFLEPNSVFWLLASSTIILFVLLGFFELLKTPTQSLSANPSFWVLTGLFVFTTSTLFMFLFQNYLVFELEVSRSLFAPLLMIVSIANIAKNFLLFYALVLMDKASYVTNKSEAP